MNERLGDAGSLTFGRFTLHRAGGPLTLNGNPIDVPSSTIEVLRALLEAQGAPRKLQFLRKILSESGHLSSSDLWSHIVKLNEIIQPQGPHYIAHLPGVGYRFVGTVSVVSDVTEAANSSFHRQGKNLIGRGDVLATLATRLRKHRFVSIVGVGGIGKTSVALALLDQLSGEMRDGALMVDLAPLTSPDQVPATVAAALGAHIDMDAETGSPLLRLQAFLENKQMIVLLDNCEHVVVAAAFMAEALLSAPGVCVLTTSREPLRARDESLYQIGGLDVPAEKENLDAAHMVAYGAVELFVERSGLGQRWHSASADLVKTVCEICRRLDGMPLALELAAAHVGSLGVVNLLDRLHERMMAFMSAENGGVAQRQLTMEATLDWSHALLSDCERRVLRRLSVFRGTFSLASALKICSEDPANTTEALEGLLNLGCKSLVSVNTVDGAILYRLLETTRIYALNKLSASSDAHQTFQRHAVDSCERVELAEEKWQSTTPVAWLEQYRGLIADVRNAIEWTQSAEGEKLLGARLILAALPLAGRLSLLREFVARIRLMLTRLAEVGALTPQVEFRLNSALGELLTYSYGPFVAAEAYARAHELIPSLESWEDQTIALVGQWGHAHHKGDYVVMLRMAEQLASRAEISRDPEEEIFSHRAMAYALHFRGDNQGARAHAIRTIEYPLTNSPASRFLPTMIDRQVGMRTVLARTFWLRGQPDQAQEVAEECVRRALVDRPTALAIALSLTACPIALWRGDNDAAQQLITYLRTHSDAYDISYGLEWAAHYQGVLDRRNLVSTTAPAPTNPVEADMLVTMDGSSLTQDTVERVEQGVVGWCAPEVFRVAGEMTMGDASSRTAALAYWQRSLKIAEEQGSLAWRLRTATSWAAHLNETYQKSDAVAVLSPIYQQFTEGFTTADLCKARSLLELCSS